MIINLTQHDSTPEQGCIEPASKADIRAALTFSDIPSREEIDRRARALAEFCLIEVGRVLGDAGGDKYPAPDDIKAGVHGAIRAMIGGAPFLMPALERELRRVGIRPVYAFSRRESVETTDPETGAVKKTAVFRHIGFVGA